ncbi:GNAT family N-acetyltransferase [Vibrio ostreicida]|uniref:GNAT family N-acetyltransferase n=1 Tax=Vibrio ostreicida TaxID=526588 RepID=A0ABT8BYR6_9VIBR|nr:GNAT family N-acetyltransferase [Vibrio ostreicida]MDN3612311.1 GNAT family N-acetyltransferase [Vibrio ostreicida]NPD08694.1 GNAT family N-acetyltransferase [Vibrio ostreicida]
MEIIVDDLKHPDVISLLEQHRADMNATSPPESVHTLDLTGLKAPEMTLWTAWRETVLLGCIAIKTLSETHVELKSMRTTDRARNQGVASSMLTHAINESAKQGYRQMSLETGSMAFFKPARNLYKKFGFTDCLPFADYGADPNSCFMTRKIDLN